MREAQLMRRPARLYAAKVHTPEEIAGMREVCKVRSDPSSGLTFPLASQVRLSPISTAELASRPAVLAA
jgi:hypothetical protein